MNKEIKIGNHFVGETSPVFVVAILYAGTFIFSRKSTEVRSKGEEKHSMPSFSASSFKPMAVWWVFRITPWEPLSPQALSP